MRDCFDAPGADFSGSAETARISGGERAPAEAAALARLEAEFESRVCAWQRQIDARLAQIGADAQMGLKEIFLAEKQVTPADYEKLNERMTQQMQSYLKAKNQAAEDYYAKAARPEFAVKSLLRIQKLWEEAAARLSAFYSAAAPKVNESLAEAFGILNPAHSAEAAAMREADKLESSAQKIYDIVMFAVFVILLPLLILALALLSGY